MRQAISAECKECKDVGRKQHGLSRTYDKKKKTQPVDDQALCSIAINAKVTASLKNFFLSMPDRI